tara:strand:+ start:229 stop:1782 length:1554 start_codon:yes stop_codon:yes gene_type:complete
MSAQFDTFDTPPDAWQGTPGVDAGARGAILDFLSRVDLDGDGQRYRDFWQGLHCFLLGEHRAALESRLAVLYEETAPIWNELESGHRYFPLIRMYTDRLAVVTHRPAETWLVQNGQRLPEDHPLTQRWRGDEETLQLDERLPAAERLLLANNNVLVNPGWVGGKPRWNVLAPYEVRVDQDPDEPDQIAGAPHISVMLPQTKDSDSQAAVEANALWLTWRRAVTRDAWGGIKSQRWEVWLHDRAGQARRNPLFRDNVNRYGVHPFVLWRLGSPTPGRVWVPPNVGWYHQQLSADIKLCDLDHHMRLQMHSQLVLNGGGDLKNIPLGPDRAIHSPSGDVDAEYLTPNPNVSMGIAHFNFDLRATAVAEGLPPDTWEPNSSTRNLAAKQLEQAALQARRRAMVPAAKRMFCGAFEIHKRVVAVHRGGAAYPPDVTLGVEFAPLPEVVDKFQDTQSTAVKLTHNLTNHEDVLMRQDGLTRTQARAKLERNREINAQFGAAAAPPVAAVAGEGVPRPVSTET